MKLRCAERVRPPGKRLRRCHLPRRASGRENLCGTHAAMHARRDRAAKKALDDYMERSREGVFRPALIWRLVWRQAK